MFSARRLSTLILIVGSACSGSSTAPPEVETMSKLTGDGQAAVAGQAVAIPPAVKIVDNNGHPDAGVSVTFAVASGGGSVTGATQTTNADGVATVGSWRLGSAAGPNSLTAAAAAVTGSPLTFTATGQAGQPASIAKRAGDGQSANAGDPVATAPSVMVADVNGNPVSGVSVLFAVSSGGGATQGALTPTGADGIATVGGWYLGPAEGPDTLTATVAGLGPASFAATTLVPGGYAAFQSSDQQAPLVHAAFKTRAGVWIAVPGANGVYQVPLTNVPGDPISIEMTSLPGGTVASAIAFITVGEATDAIDWVQALTLSRGKVSVTGLNVAPGATFRVALGDVNASASPPTTTVDLDNAVIGKPLGLVAGERGAGGVLTRAAFRGGVAAAANGSVQIDFSSSGHVPVTQTLAYSGEGTGDTLAIFESIVSRSVEFEGVYHGRTAPSSPAPFYPFAAGVLPGTALQVVGLRAGGVGSARTVRQALGSPRDVTLSLGAGPTTLNWTEDVGKPYRQLAFQFQTQADYANAWIVAVTQGSSLWRLAMSSAFLNGAASASMAIPDIPGFTPYGPVPGIPIQFLKRERGWSGGTGLFAPAPADNLVFREVTLDVVNLP